MAETLYNPSGHIINEKKSTIGCCYIDGCNKKLGIMPFVCRCQKEFCAKHRMPELHQCSFDYKTYEKKKLQEANKQIIFTKIKQI